MQKRGKKAEIMGMPFQFIFALILIAVALFVGFFTIKMFLERAEQAEFGLFVSDLQNQVIDVWQAEEAGKTISLDINQKIIYVCFVNSSRCSSPIERLCSQARLYPDKNLFFYPFGEAEKYDSNSQWKIQCGAKDMPKECIAFANPTCIPVQNGKVKIRLENPGNRTVIISQG